MKVLISKLKKVLRDLPSPTYQGETLRVRLDSAALPVPDAKEGAAVPKVENIPYITLTAVEFRVGDLYRWYTWELEI